jgi:hypothetical protein
VDSAVAVSAGGTIVVVAEDVAIAARGQCCCCCCCFRGRYCRCLVSLAGFVDKAFSGDNIIDNY